MSHKVDQFKSDEVEWEETIDEIHSTANEKGFWDKMDDVLDKMDSFSTELDFE